MTKTLGVGMLGTGWMGRVHTHAYKTAQYMFSDQVQTRLVAIGGSSLEKGRAAAERFGYEEGACGYEAITANPEVDVFNNAAPDNIHMEPTIAAARAGKHVVCEKPLAVRPEDALKMLQAVNNAGVKHLCCFNYRFFPAVRLAYDLITQGALGKLYHFNGVYLQDHGSAEDTPAENVWYVGGSGIAQGIGSHLIDMARFLMGEVNTVHGMIKTHNKIRQSARGPIAIRVDESLGALFAFKSGATGVLHSSGVASGRQSRFAIEISGSKGSLSWNVEEPNDLNVYLRQSAHPTVVGWTKICVTEPNHPFMDIWWPRGHILGWEHAHINMLAHFLNCVADDLPVAPLAATFEDGWRVARIIEQIFESSEK